MSPATEAERPDTIDGSDTSRDIRPLPAPVQALPTEQPDAVQPLLPRPQSEESLPRQLPTSNVVKVSIGRIEVRASQPAAQAKPEFARLRPRAKFQQRMGLSDYMAKKRGNR